MDFRLVNKTHSNGQIHFDIVDASSALHVTIVANECVHICLLPASMTSTVYDGSNQNHMNIVRYSLICHTPAFRLSIHFFSFHFTKALHISSYFSRCHQIRKMNKADK